MSALGAGYFAKIRDDIVSQGENNKTHAQKLKSQEFFAPLKIPAHFSAIHIEYFYPNITALKSGKSVQNSRISKSLHCGLGIPILSRGI